MTEQIRYKVGVCNKISPKLLPNSHVVLEAMRGRDIHAYMPNISHMVEKRMDRNSMLMIERYMDDYKHDYNFQVLYHRPKKCDGGEFGYYVSNSMSHVLNFMQIIGIKKICDIGCGFGVAMKVLEKEDITIDVRGYDNEPYLIELADDKRFEVKDALKLQEGDLLPDELVYLWEPFRDKNLSLRFVKNLVNVTEKEQIVVIHSCPYENTVTNLLHHPSFEYTCNFGKKYIFVRK